MKTCINSLIYMINAPDLKSLDRKVVRVQVPPRAPYRFTNKINDKQCRMTAS